MAYAAGKDALFGAVKATTWGTAVAVGASNKGFRATSWKFSDNSEDIPDLGMNGSRFWRESALVGNYKVEGSFEADLKYQGLEIIQALALGTAGVPTGAGPYVHTWYAKQDMAGVFGSLAWFDNLKTHEIDSFKVTKLTFKGEPGKVVSMGVDWRGRLRTENSATNANLSSLTEPSAIDRVQCLNATNTYQGALIGSALATIELLSWDVAFEFPLDENLLYTSSTAPYIREPIAKEVKVSGSITIPYEAVTLWGYQVAGSLYKIKLTHTLTSSKIWTLALPSMKFQSVDANFNGKGGMPLKINFTCEKSVSAPSTYSQGVPYIEATNSFSTDPLA